MAILARHVDHDLANLVQRRRRSLDLSPIETDEIAVQTTTEKSLGVASSVDQGFLVGLPSESLELLGKRYSVPTVKQNLATIRMLFDWLLLGQIVASNPAHAVRGPKHVINRGKTPILDEESAQKLLGAINTNTLVGLRDKALIAVMIYLFARIDAALKTNIDDYYAEGKRWRLRFHEKNAKDVSKPVPHKLEAILDAYIEAAGLSGKNTPLFQSTRGRSGVLTGRRMSPSDAWRMVQRRARDADIETHICCHTFRGTGITNYLENGGSVEKAAEMANHSSIRTTKLYDRRNDEPTLEEFEKISI
jgi:site-specific recombinase XerD